MNRNSLSSKHRLYKCIFDIEFFNLYSSESIRLIIFFVLNISKMGVLKDCLWIQTNYKYYLINCSNNLAL